MSKKPLCTVIVITNNNEMHLTKNMECLRNQTRKADQIILVDTGSKNPQYVTDYGKQENVTVIFAEKGVGFCVGNNVGYSHVSAKTDYVFLLNPDAFITPRYLEEAIKFMERAENQRVGAVTGTTLGYDINADKPTGKYDTTGIFQKWYGKWNDRGQGEEYNPSLYTAKEEIPAICGAVFFCRKKALDQVLLRQNEILDSTFFMYKDDIDLSMRLRTKGWKLVFLPQLLAYHCRGWNPDRKKMLRIMRVCSAKNELRIHARTLSPVKTLYSGLKYTLVKVFDI